MKQSCWNLFNYSNVERGGKYITEVMLIALMSRQGLKGRDPSAWPSGMETVPSVSSLKAKP